MKPFQRSRRFPGVTRECQRTSPQHDGIQGVWVDVRALSARTEIRSIELINPEDVKNDSIGRLHAHQEDHVIHHDRPPPGIIAQQIDKVKREHHPERPETMREEIRFQSTQKGVGQIQERDPEHSNLEEITVGHSCWLFKQSHPCQRNDYQSQYPPL
jgi:hypothetical protein